MHKDRQGRLFEMDSVTGPERPVECLGMFFENDEKRREYFLEKLREKLKAPKFRKIEGFPIGKDEDILALSDPPYYTACPNPFIEDFIKYYGRPYDPLSDDYRREPFAVDVSEGKGDRSYYIHTYHTKVPPSAIAKYVSHYTSEGSLILDCFSGSGMTAIGSSLASKNTAATLLVDLCTSAGFISYFHNLFRPSNNDSRVFESLVDELRDSFGDWYYTKHTGWPASLEAPASWKTRKQISTQVGQIRYVVWSIVVSCPECSHIASLWDLCVNLHENTSAKSFKCPSCDSNLAYERKYAKKYGAQLVDKMYETVHDSLLGTTLRRVKRLPVLVSYDFQSKRFEKCPDSEDLLNIKEAEGTPVKHWCPTGRMPEGDESRRNDEAGLTHVHHFFSARTLHVLAAAAKQLRSEKPALLGLLTSILQRCSWQNRYMPQHRGNRSREVVGPLSGTLYVPYFCLEINPIEYINRKGISVLRNLSKIPITKSIISTQSASSLECLAGQPNSVDYVFVDPPFGANLQYTELSFVVESWLKVVTSNKEEAVVNKTREITVDAYTNRIRDSLRSVYRMLKPSRWMTVEFHNSQNAIWTAIQTAINDVGFIVADVRTLDKKKGTTKQLTLANTVKQDLVITAYKPNDGLEERFKIEAGTEDGVWDFARTHLKQLPVFVSKDGQAEVITERQNYLLFDRMVAFHVQRGVTVPLSAAEFYAGLEQRFPPREGMYFLADQVAEYDKKRMTVKEILQLQLFVTDEASSIQWLKQQLTKKPQTFQDIHPQFLKELGGWQKHEKPLELSELLKENFLSFDGQGEVPSQIHSYLSSNFKELRNLAKDNSALRAKGKDRWYVPDPNKAGDLEKLRDRSLMREFEEYRESKQKRLKVFRLEAVRSGFKKAWQERDYATIIAVARKIPEKILQEDPKLLMWYDQAVTRKGEYE